MATQAKSVQFREAEDIINTYQDNNSPAFAIFHNDTLIHKYTGDDLNEGCELLAKWLVKLENSAAIYTLRIYDKVPGDGSIRSQTPYDGSFNFRFREYDAMGGTSKTDSKVLEILTRMDQRIAELEQEKEEKENSGPALGWVGDLLAHPEIKNIAMGIMSGVLQNVVGSLKLPQPATVGNINSDPLQTALAILAKNDARLIEHLQKLAALSEQNKAMFDMLLKTLDGM